MKPVNPVRPLLFASSVRHLESKMLAASGQGELMDMAADALADRATEILRQIPGAPGIVGLIGPGNNGADVIACLYRLQQRGYRACAACMADHDNPPQWQHWMTQWINAGGHTIDLGKFTAEQELATDTSLLIDGLFGIGLNRPLAGSAAAAAALTHRVSCPVLAADVPSGLDCNTGQVIGAGNGIAVRASDTVTFIADKPGLHTGQAAQYAGRVTVATLGASQLDVEHADGVLVDRQWAVQQISPRSRNAHKGSFGTVAIVGGAASMPGAALLAAHGARAAGAGKIATLSPDSPVFDSASPQIMAWTARDNRALAERLASVQAIAIGCGLGQSDRAAQWLETVIESTRPLVIDADGLNLLSDPAQGAMHQAALAKRTEDLPTVVTPHPLEAARLLASDTAAVQADRIGAAQALARKLSATVVLKGNGTVVCAVDQHWQIVDSGNSALATGGTGDVLSGVIAGLLAQGYGATRAAGLGAWLHGRAADRWRVNHRGGIGMDLGDLVDCIVDTINHPGQTLASRH